MRVNINPHLMKTLQQAFWFENSSTPIIISMSFKNILSVPVIILSFLLTHKFSFASDTIDGSGIVTYSRTLISSGGRFELGFFSPGRSYKWYLGIWFNGIPDKTVVWVASREVPLVNQSSGTLKIAKPGILVLFNETGNVIWSTPNASSAIVKNPVLQLLESGNLVLREADDDQLENYLWQSFNYPTDTLLLGMSLSVNLVAGGESYLSSWRSSVDPAPGEYTFHFDPTGYPQLFGKRNGINVYRYGPWNGKVYSGKPQVKVDLPFTFGIYKNKQGAWYYRVDTTTTNSTLMMRHTITPSGVGERWIWSDRAQSWVLLMSDPRDNCDTYKLCGAYGMCTIWNMPVCGCLDGFVPKNLQEWTDGDWSSGCTRRTPLNCEKGDGFKRFSDIKLPDARNSWYSESMTLDECRVHCLENCSCMAYSSLNISNGESGCLIWFGDLVDMRTLTTSQGQVLYIRVASSELDSKGRRRVILSLTLIGAFLLISGLALYIRKKKNCAKRRTVIGIESEDMELPLFDLSTISKATNGFSLDNKLGEGGYGPVYKGTLQDGLVIAVKRLSETSKQGLQEFKNEVICIANLQHRNLVKLIGCCIQGEEKMLIYEYMPNKSLDRILFDDTNRTSLDWPTRFNIVNGIARGLMYLHHDSSLRIIHRDLKASNILLDREMNAKISDFGIARPYTGNETGDTTNRVVGTHGYMPPEYAINGRFSVKSDVFSFGVMVLEIVRGERNSSYSHGDQHLTLLSHGWILYKEGRSIELVDSHLHHSDNLEKALRLIHVGLLCVQQHPNDRPNMVSIVTWLGNDTELPSANPPCFFPEMYAPSSGSHNPANISNEITNTLVEGR